MSAWRSLPLGDILNESKVESTKPDPNKRITVKLNVKGVEKRPFEEGVEGGTKYFTRKAGQFIYGKQNLFKGAFGLVPHELDGFESSQDIPAFDISKDCLPEWLMLFFKQGEFYKSLESIATGTGSRRIQPAKLFEVEIPLPTIAEQKKIIEQVSEYEQKHSSLTSEITSQLADLQRLRQSILQEAVQGKLVPQDKNDEPASELLKKIKAEKEALVKAGKLKKEKQLPPITEEEIPFELPEGWVWCRLGEVFDSLKYGTSQKCSYKKGDHTVLRIPNISKGVLDFTDIKYANLPREEFEELRLRENDILMIRSNGSESIVGRTAVFGKAEFQCAYAGYLVRLRFNGLFGSTQYFHFCLENNYARQLIEQPLRTTSGVKNINSTEISRILIPLPPLAEQRRIVSKVESLMQTCDELEQELKSAQSDAGRLLQAVLREAFAG